MNFFSSTLSKLAAAAAIIAMPILLSSCGGGSSSSSGEETLIRPQTLDGLILTLDDNTIQLIFTRATDSIVAGDSAIEFGSISYGANNKIALKKPLLQGTFTNIADIAAAVADPAVVPEVVDASAGIDVTWPVSVGSMTYTYQPLNNISGILLIQARNSEYLYRSGNAFPRSGAGSSDVDVRYFSRASPWTTRFLLTFGSTGNVINNSSVHISPIVRFDAAVEDLRRIADGEEDLTYGSADNISFIELATLRTEAGGVVPLNYDVTRDINGDSPLAIPTLGTRALALTIGGFGSVDRFYECSVTTPASSSLDGIEAGTVDLRTVDPAFSTSTTVDAGTFMYQRIQGTDQSTFTVEDPVTPANNFNILLSFVSAESLTRDSNASGTYTVTSGPNTGETGRFEVQRGF